MCFFLPCHFAHCVNFMFGALASQPKHSERVENQHQRVPRRGWVGKPRQAQLGNAREERCFAQFGAKGLHERVRRAAPVIYDKRGQIVQPLCPWFLDGLAFECQPIILDFTRIVQQTYSFNASKQTSLYVGIRRAYMNRYRICQRQTLCRRRFNTHAL